MLLSSLNNMEQLSGYTTSDLDGLLAAISALVCYNIRNRGEMFFSVHVYCEWATLFCEGPFSFFFLLEVILNDNVKIVMTTE